MSDSSSDEEPYFFFLLKRDVPDLYTQSDRDGLFTGKSVGAMIPIATEKDMELLEDRELRDGELRDGELRDGELRDGEREFDTDISLYKSLYPLKSTDDLHRLIFSAVDSCARVELESTLLKRFMKDDVVDTLDSIKLESCKSYTTVKQQLLKIDAKLARIDKSQSYSKDLRSVNTKLDLLLNKIATIETNIKENVCASPRSRCDDILETVNKRNEDNAELKEYLTFIVRRMLGMEKSLSSFMGSINLQGTSPTNTHATNIHPTTSTAYIPSKRKIL